MARTNDTANAAMMDANHAYNLLSSVARKLRALGHTDAAQAAESLADSTFALRDAVSWYTEPGRDPQQGDTQAASLLKRLYKRPRVRTPKCSGIAGTCVRRSGHKGHCRARGE